MLSDFRTPDLNLASYLYSASVDFHGLDRSDPENIVFTFTQPPAHLMEAWQSGVATGNIQLYSKARAYLLNIVKRGGNGYA